jgi:PAS domain S-box-containing protein
MPFGLGKHKNDEPNAPSGDWHDSQQRFKVIVENLQDGVVLFDEQGVIQLINPAAARMAAWTVDEAIGVSVEAVFKMVTAKGEALPDGDNPLKKIFQVGQGLQDDEAAILNRQRQQISISLSLSPLFDNQKHVTAAVAIIRDVSTQRAQEQQRADFISTASHEMRTPVAAIEGYLALALNANVSTVDNRARGYLEKAHSSTQHLGKLFQDLLTSAKAEDGRLTSHPTAIEMGDLLQQLSDDLRFAAEKKGLFLEFAVGNHTDTVNATPQAIIGGGEHVVRPLYYVYADPDRLREVLTNLVDNAIKYTEEGRITLGLTGNDQVVQFAVKDTGPGIPAEDLPHLFQKFYRVDNSATRTIGGTGLGLFICRKIVELYQGRIWVESEPGKGSSFYINLPRLTIEQAEKLQQSAAATPAPLANPGDVIQ